MINPTIALVMVAALASQASSPSPTVKLAKPAVGKPLILRGKPVTIPRGKPATVPVQRPKLSTTVVQDIRKKQEAARAQQEVDRKLAACNADGGAWTAEVKGISLSAGGSDVDEIYGKISVVDIPGAQFSNSRIDTRAGWGLREIWASDKNVNIGKYTQRNLSRVTIKSNRSIDAIGISMQLYDEDDGRGGSNDEYFYLSGSNFTYTNVHRFDVYVPPCRQSVDFSRTWRVNLTGRPRGSASGNSVTLSVRVQISRSY